MSLIALWLWNVDAIWFKAAALKGDDTEDDLERLVFTKRMKTGK